MGEAPTLGPAPGDGRPRVDGKLLAVGDERLWLRGVTYGPFAPTEDGSDLGDRAQTSRDLEAMAAAGINAIRTYSPPPTWVLDLAAENGIWVLVGLAWEQHITFLDDRRRPRDLIRRARATAEAVAGHPALLGYAVGNEVPSSIVRWHGRRRMARFIERMCAAVRSADPEALVTYVNYPSTEYLRLPYIDFFAFNVYLEDPARLTAYVARLQNLAGERPLVLTEIGLDSRRNGESEQAASLYAQLRSGFRGGCAGAFAFAWTDEWHRGGEEILDWDFGLTDRRRRPKPALKAATLAYSNAPVVDSEPLPSFSAVVCTHNGAATLDECLAGLGRLDYHDYEVIVVDDGSGDHSAEIAERHGVRLLRTPPRGLSAARNEGLAAARGELIAFIDDDAAPDPQWLTYLAVAFADSRHAAVGGPNLPFPRDGRVAACVANAPGGPQHVLLDDTLAEHIPGCNMAFRTRDLKAIGGFDEQFLRAGDDVDICWRLQAQAMTIGFHPAAVVWHHRRPKVRRYLKQQRGYGEAEALLERKWPEKYNSVGQPRWRGSIYGPEGATRFSRSRVYYGIWGTGAFQPAVERKRGWLAALGTMPELHLLALALLALTAASSLVSELVYAAIPLALVALTLLCSTVTSLAAARFPGTSLKTRLLLYPLTAALLLLQPLSRLHGRLSNGLSPWRLPRGATAMSFPGTTSVWAEHWVSPDDRLARVESIARAKGFSVRRGDAFSRWDLEVRAGALSGVRVRMGVEEHGRGRQMLRARTTPAPARWQFAVAIVFTALAGLAIAEDAWLVFVPLALAAISTVVAISAGCGLAAAATAGAVRSLPQQQTLAVISSTEPDTGDPAAETVDPRHSEAAIAGTRP